MHRVAGWLWCKVGEGVGTLKSKSGHHKEHKRTISHNQVILYKNIQSRFWVWYKADATPLKVGITSGLQLWKKLLTFDSQKPGLNPRHQPARNTGPWITANGIPVRFSGHSPSSSRRHSSRPP